MTVELRREVVVGRDPDAVFALVDDIARYPEFFRGITRWEPRSEQVRGVGASFRVLMQVGSIEAGGVVTVTERDEDERVISWRSETGVEQAGRWRVTPAPDGSRLVLEVSFRLAGPVRWLVEAITGRIVARNLDATLLAARRLLELEGG